MRKKEFRIRKIYGWFPMPGSEVVVERWFRGSQDINPAFHGTQRQTNMWSRRYEIRINLFESPAHVVVVVSLDPHCSLHSLIRLDLPLVPLEIPALQSSGEIPLQPQLSIVFAEAYHNTTTVVKMNAPDRYVLLPMDRL